MNTLFFKEIIQWIAIGILSFLLFYTALQKPSEMQKHISFLTIASILFLAGYLIKINADSLHSAMTGATVSYIGQSFALLTALMMIASFYGYHIPKGILIPLTLLAVVVPVAVYTNPSHYLFYATAEYDPDAAFSPLVTTRGPLYIANLGLAAGYFVSYAVMIFHGYGQMKSQYKRNLAIYSILMLVSALTGYVVYFLDLTGGYDSTMLGLFFSTVFLSVLFFRCRIFNFLDKAKDYALDISSEGVVVFDDANCIVYKNIAAEKMMDKDLPKEYIENLPEGTCTCDRNSHHYAVCVQLINNDDYCLGRSVEMHDTTESVDHRERLEEAVRETRERLETVQRTIFGSMANIVEARSVETGDHIKRVREYTEKIARTLRSTGKYKDVLTDEYISMLSLATPLHDIGKIAIPDAVLLKPGRLTADEFDIMKTHAAKGADIIVTAMSDLESDEYITMAADGARYHHEWWNGKGYPSGLAGENIPLCARIIAIADCYDAMTSKRCYKDAFQNEKAISIIKEESGTHFDPSVVEAFIKCM